MGVKDGDARDRGDVVIRASCWGAANERAVFFTLLFWNDQPGWNEDGRWVGEWGRRRESHWGEGGFSACGPFCLHLRVCVAAVDEETKWEGK